MLQVNIYYATVALCIAPLSHCPNIIYINGVLRVGRVEVLRYRTRTFIEVVIDKGSWVRSAPKNLNRPAASTAVGLD